MIDLIALRAKYQQQLVAVKSWAIVVAKGADEKDVGASQP